MGFQRFVCERRWYTWTGIFKMTVLFVAGISWRSTVFSPFFSFSSNFGKNDAPPYQSKCLWGGGSGTKVAVADPEVQFFSSISCRFWKNWENNSWCPNLLDWRHLFVWEILDPPLGGAVVWRFTSRSFLHILPFFCLFFMFVLESILLTGKLHNADVQAPKLKSKSLQVT